MKELYLCADNCRLALLKLRKNYNLDQVVKIEVIQSNPSGRGPVVVKFFFKCDYTPLEISQQVVTVPNIFTSGTREFSTWRLNDALQACGVSKKDASEIFWTNQDGVYVFIPRIKLP